MSKLMSLADAQRALGWEGPGGRRLRRYLVKREKKIGRRIMLRVGTPGKHRHGGGAYRVTMSALRRWCPELFDAEVSMATFREYVKGIDSRISLIVAEHVAEHVEPRLDELWQRDETIQNNLNELAVRVNTLAGLMTKTNQNQPKPGPSLRGVTTRVRT